MQPGDTCLRIIAVTAAAVLLGGASAAAACVGDCDGDGRVAIEEVLGGVAIALGNMGTHACGAFDVDHDGTVAVHELVDGVGSALGGCPFAVLYDRTDPRATTPFPDDFWLVQDDGSATGVRLAVPLPQAPEDVQQVYRALLADANLLDGFSPIAHFVVRLSRPADVESLPRTPAESLHPESSVALFDLDSTPRFGRRVPVLVKARSDRTPLGLSAHTLLIFPSVPLTPRGRYALVITGQVRSESGQSLEPSPFFRRALSPPVEGEPEAVGRVRALVDAVLRGPNPPPISRDTAALVLRISIRSTDSIPSDLVAVKEQVLAAAPPAVTITSVEPDPSAHVAAIVQGAWEAPEWRFEVPGAPRLYFFRDFDGRPIRTGTKPVPFTLALPMAALDGPVPLTMYQHGNPGSAQAEVPGSARRYLAEAGFAVIGFTDTLNRELSPGVTDQMAALTLQVAGVLFPLLNNFKVPDFWVQTTAEQIAFLRMIEGLGTLDVLPIGAPDGAPDLDVGAPLTYVGISEGANNGQAILPYAPEIRAAALVVGGARLAEVLIHQQAEQFLTALSALFPNATPADIWAGFSLFQTIFDVQDRHNHASFIYRDPLPVRGTTRKASILVIEGLNDSLVPNHATDSLAWILGPIPHLEPVQRPVPFLQPALGPIVANVDEETTAAFYQYVPVGLPDVAPTPGCTVLSERSAREGHYCAQSARESLRQRVVFFQTALTDPAPSIIDPLSAEGNR